MHKCLSRGTVVGVRDQFNLRISIYIGTRYRKFSSIIFLPHSLPPILHKFTTNQHVLENYARNTRSSQLEILKRAT